MDGEELKHVERQTLIRSCSSMLADRPPPALQLSWPAFGSFCECLNDLVGLGVGEFRPEWPLQNE